MIFNSRRADCSGYLELIWRADVPRPDGATPQAIAYITDMYGSIRKPWYFGAYGIHTVEGPTVASVKAELFSLIEAGQ
jgi:hypothetical protein